MKVAKTTCGMCVTRCGIDIYVDNGRMVKYAPMNEHPIRMLCPKIKGIFELEYSSERLINPLRKTDSGFEQISWDEALHVIADKLNYIKEKYGSKALVTFLGDPVAGTQLGRVVSRFCTLYGTPNFTTTSSSCFAPRGIGAGLAISKRILPLLPSFENTRCVVVWGCNPEESDVVNAAHIRSAKKQGAKSIVIDPRATKLAKEADIHVQIRPGTDCALALGLLNVIIAEHLYDRNFVEQWTLGFGKLVEHVKHYSPERVEEISWIPAESIRNIARMYASSKPSVIVAGVALDHSTNTIHTHWAITTLIGITGNVDVPGGNIYRSFINQAVLRVKGMVNVNDIMSPQYPIFNRFTGEAAAQPVPDAILTGKPYSPKALIVHGGNPVSAWPNTKRVIEALRQLELLVVIDWFMTDTAKMADIVLPGTTFLEKQDLRDYRNRSLSHAFVTEQALTPPGEVMEDWKIWAELGKRMDYTEYFPWDNTDELLRTLLEPANVSLDELKSPGGAPYMESDFEKYRKEGFNTPSEKMEFYSETMQRHGYEPLPTFHEPAESPVSRPDLADSYPLILLTGTRKIALYHSEYRHLPSLNKMEPEPLIEINRQTANNLGIANGDPVEVESLRGSIKLKAELTDNIHPKVVSMQHGWSQANANYLTDDKALDPVSGHAGFKSVMCRVIKIEQ
jgi:anaerobic selenocysteine-containing dehydrogenase